MASHLMKLVMDRVFARNWLVCGCHHHRRTFTDWLAPEGLCSHSRVEPTLVSLHSIQSLSHLPCEGVNDMAALKRHHIRARMRMDTSTPTSSSIRCTFTHAQVERLHAWPHYDLRFMTASSEFNPQDRTYLQAVQGAGQGRAGRAAR